MKKSKKAFVHAAMAIWYSRKDARCAMDADGADAHNARAECSGSHLNFKKFLKPFHPILDNQIL